jgi:protease I
MHTTRPDTLTGKKVAILVCHGFEESELLKPQSALEAAGAQTFIISPEIGGVKSWSGEAFGDSLAIDQPLASARAEDYDALLLPGGVINPDSLRTHRDAIDLVRAFFQAGKPVAAICHGPQTLIEAGVVGGRRLTSYPSIRRDLINAGAHWVDEEVVVDQGLVTSRQPADIPAFNRKMIEEIAEGIHAGQHA